MASLIRPVNKHEETTVVNNGKAEYIDYCYNEYQKTPKKDCILVHFIIEIAKSNVLISLRRLIKMSLQF